MSKNKNKNKNKDKKKRKRPDRPEPDFTALPPVTPPDSALRGPDAEGVDLPSIRSFLLRASWVVLLSATTAVAATAVATALLPKTFESSATFLVEVDGSGSNYTALEVLERLGRGRQIETEMELVRSRRVLEPLVDSLTLPEHPESETADPLERARRLQTLRNRVSVRRVHRDADLIRIGCTGYSAAASQTLCSAVTEGYLELRTELRRSEATAARTFLSGQLERIGEQLRTAEDSLEAYGRRFRVVALDERASGEVRQLTELRARRDLLEAERAALAEVLADVTLRGESRDYRELASFPSFVENEGVTGMLSSLVQLENRRSDLTLRRTDQNADVVALDLRIAQIEGQLLTTARSYESALAAQIASLDETIAAMNRRIAVMPTRQVQYTRLQRQTDQLEGLYGRIETRLREAEIAEAVNLPTVRVVDHPALPTSPSSPSMPVNLALGAVAGLAFGLLMALARGHALEGPRVRTRIEGDTGLHVLAVVPRLRHPGRLVPLTDPKWQLAAPPSTGSRSAGGWRSGRARRAAATRSAALEAYRGLAVELSHSTDGLGEVRSVMVTSAERGEGKTITACNLALARASQGYRTLLIDADLHAGKVAGFFELPPSSSGLSDLITTQPEDPSDSYPKPFAIGEHPLWVIPAGSTAANPAGLLESQGFSELVEQAGSTFDLVVIDTPPMSVVIDGAPIAKTADGVLIVVRPGVSEAESVDFTLQRLRRARARVLGVVLNAVQVSDRYTPMYSYGKV